MQADVVGAAMLAVVRLRYRPAMAETTYESTFFWHDYETFGRVPRRDRPAQFAGLRTDVELNVIGDPVMLYCQPAPDYLPDPESVLLTGILPQHALERGVPEKAFAAAIEAELARDGSIGVGYNSIRFDDEVTRHLFWRNLVDPYSREWCNGCSRWDIVDVVRAAWSLRPDGINWPTHEDGRPSFKLEHLSAANGLLHDSAHDALSDVRATIALARLIKQRQPRLWNFCLDLRKKDAVWRQIGTRQPFVHLSGMYALERGSLAIVWPLCAHPTNKNELIVWDLAHDPRELATLDAATARRRLFTRQDELPAGEQRLPVKTIHINKSPIVFSDLRALGPAAQRWAIDTDGALRHAEHCRSFRPHARRPVGRGLCTATRRNCARCRRRPVWRLHRRRRPADAPAAARSEPGRAGSHLQRPQPRFQGRSPRRAGLPLPRAQLPAHARRQRARTVATALRRTPARWGRRLPDTRNVLRAHRCTGRCRGRRRRPARTGHPRGAGRLRGRHCAGVASGGGLSLWFSSPAA
jgi:exonuclease I